MLLARHRIVDKILVFQRAVNGTILAEALLFSDEYDCGAKAQTFVHTLPSSRMVFRHALLQEPEFALAMTRHMTRAKFRKYGCMPKYYP